jgi:hypothetical protein
MKTVAIKFAALLLFALSFTACKKDKDKPFNEEIVGDWSTVEVIQDGKDITDNFKLDLNLQDDNEFDGKLTTINPQTQEVDVFDIAGEWEADSDKKEFTITYTDGFSETYKVTDVDDDNMTVKLKGQDLTMEFEK